MSTKISFGDVEPDFKNQIIDFPTEWAPVANGVLLSYWLMRQMTRFQRE